VPVIFSRYWFRSHIHSINKFLRLPYLKNRAINLSPLLSLVRHSFFRVHSLASPLFWASEQTSYRTSSFCSLRERSIRERKTFRRVVHQIAARLASGLSIIELLGNNRNYHNRSRRRCPRYQSDKSEASRHARARTKRHYVPHPLLHSLLERIVKTCWKRLERCIEF